MGIKKLKSEEVRKKRTLDFLHIKDSSELVNYDINFINQTKATEAIEFGLNIDKFGYNIYCSGNNSFYKKDYLKYLIGKIAEKQKTPNDLCYVYNFKKKTEPILITLKAGDGIVFKNAIEENITKIKNEILLYFKSTLYKKEIEKINGEFADKMEELHAEYNAILSEYQFQLVPTDDGNLTPVPSKKNKVLSQEEYDNLPQKEKDKYISNLDKVDNLLIDLFDKEEEVIENQNNTIDEAERNGISKILKRVFEETRARFLNNEKVLYYIDTLIEDLLDNISIFKPFDFSVDNIEDSQVSEVTDNIFNKNTIKSLKEKQFLKYSVNLIVDNSNLKGCPVVFVNDLIEEDNLFAYTQFNISYSNVTTDFSQIVAGEVLKANGGFLIIDTSTLFYNPGVYDRLKSVLKNKTLKINTNYYNDVLVSDSLKPEAIDVDLKVILIGDIETYYILSEGDEDFKDLFRIHALFEDQINNIDEKSITEYLIVLANYIERKGLLPFDKCALEKILEFSSRIADNQESYSLDYIKIHSLLNEADAFAKKKGLNVVNSDCINDSYEWRIKRVNIIEDYQMRNLKRNIILLNVDGEEIGVVNGLTVSDYSDFSIGSPVKITCNTYMGEDGIISVDRVSELTGPIHDKAIEIIKGCVGKYLAKKQALPLNISLSFEQCYSGIEGDSATCAEMCAIFSDLFEIPVKQYFAITGSMNQKGQVQAIGGVNEKIEGFYRTCKILGRNNKQGVIIPESNKYDLMLSEEIVEAIKEETFHIYTVNSLEDVLEIMLNLNPEDFKREIEDFCNKNK